MDEKKIDELRKLRDAGKITDDDFRAMVAGEVESSTTTDAPLDDDAKKARRKKIVIAAAIAAVVGVGVFAANPGHVFSMKPSDMSDAAWSAGREAYSVGEKYDAGTMLAGDAEAKLRHLSSDLKDAGYSSTDDYSVMTYIDGMEYGVEYGSDDMLDTSMDGLKSTLGY